MTVAAVVKTVKACSVCRQMIAPGAAGPFTKGEDLPGSRAARRSTTFGRNARPPGPAGVAVAGGPAVSRESPPPHAPGPQGGG